MRFIDGNQIFPATIFDIYALLFANLLDKTGFCFKNYLIKFKF